MGDVVIEEASTEVCVQRILAPLLAVGCLGLLCSGCLSYSTLHGAEPVAEGETELMIAPGGLADRDADGSGAFPTGELAVRRGISSETDVGAKFFSLGASLDLNRSVIETPSFSASLNPYVSFTHYGEADTSFGALGLVNVLADVFKSDSLDVTVGLKPGVTYGYADVLFGSHTLEQDELTPLLGAMSGLRFPVSESISLMPSVDVMVPLIDESADEIWATGSVGVSFGL